MECVMPAILFGSISTVADTSEIQRQAFNEAFRIHGLDWTWDQDDYRRMLAGSGGRNRIAEYARDRGEEVDAQAVHETKSSVFQKRLAEADLAPRAGVVDTIKAAKADGGKVALVTTTSRDNITALLEAIAPDVRAADFDVVVDAGSVDTPKPDGAAYTYALQQLGETPDDCIAIEDNVGGVGAAVAAGVRCIAFPNENTAGHDFSAADRTVDYLDAAQLRSLIVAA
jgi:HAD superfamily hydrolase (TIGR01509 family)